MKELFPQPRCHKTTHEWGSRAAPKMQMGPHTVNFSVTRRHFSDQRNAEFPGKGSKDSQASGRCHDLRGCGHDPQMCRQVLTRGLGSSSDTACLCSSGCRDEGFDRGLLSHVLEARCRNPGVGVGRAGPPRSLCQACGRPSSPCVLTSSSLCACLRPHLHFLSG